MGVKSQTISNGVAHLKEFEVVNIVYTTIDKIEHRYIYINPEYPKIYNEILSEKGYKNINRGIVEKLYPPIKKLIGNSYITYKNKKDSKKSNLTKYEIAFSQVCKTIPVNWNNSPEFLTALESYFIHRKQKQSTLTQEGARRMAKKWSEYDIDVIIAAIDMSVENGWTGVFPDKVEDVKSQVPGKDPDQIISENFNSSYSKTFRKYYVAAADLLQKPTDQDLSALAQNMVDLRNVIKQNQSDKVQANMDIPSAGGLVREYVNWLDVQTWINTIEPNMFCVDHKIFQRFTKSYSSDIGADVMEGTMV